MKLFFSPPGPSVYLKFYNSCLIYLTAVYKAAKSLGSNHVPEISCFISWPLTSTVLLAFLMEGPTALSAHCEWLEASWFFFLSFLWLVLPFFWSFTILFGLHLMHIINLDEVYGPVFCNWLDPASPWRVFLLLKLNIGSLGDESWGVTARTMPHVTSKDDGWVICFHLLCESQ